MLQNVTVQKLGYICICLTACFGCDFFFPLHFICFFFFVKGLVYLVMIFSTAIISSSRHPFCRLAWFHSEKLRSPWRYEWPRCWGPRQANSLVRFGGILGLALHRSHPPPVGNEKTFYQTRQQTERVRAPPPPMCFFFL